MNPILKSVIVATPFIVSATHADPAASFSQVSPADGGTVSGPRAVLTGTVTHDVYPAPLIAATLNGNPIPLDRSGRFNLPLNLRPGVNEFTLRANTPDPRQQLNTISAFIDASMVYGSDETRARALRSFVGGKLLTSGDNLPLHNTQGLANANDSGFFANDQLFLCGDIRANENPELASIHTLFLREHNQLASAIAAANPNLSDEAIYQRARRLVTAEIQAITYREFLPALLGPNLVRRYSGYRPDVNPGMATEFTTAAFRIGHTLVNDDIEFLNNDAEEIAEGLTLAYAFFNPQPLEQLGPDPVLKYLATDNAQEVDTQLVDGLRNFLFGPPGAGGLDLAALNIQRGRDHGIHHYNAVRRAYGLPPVRSFSEITRNPSLQLALAAVYSDPNQLDLWIGGLAEDHLPGSSVGPTFQRIIADQFERTRDGDAFWYERTFSGRQLGAIQATRLSDIIRRNTTITKLQDNVFFYDPDRTLGALTERKGFLPPALIQGNDLGLSPATYDGSGNNTQHPTWGAAQAMLLRLSPAAYADGVSQPSGADRPGPREISNSVCQQTESLSNDRLMSSWVYGWGQFIDHDLGLTPTGGESFNIPVPAGDPSFDPNQTGTVVIPTHRSVFSENTGGAPDSTVKTIRLTVRGRPPGR